MKLNKQLLIIDNQAIYDIEDWSLVKYQDLIAIRELPDYIDKGLAFLGLVLGGE